MIKTFPAMLALLVIGGVGCRQPHSHSYPVGRSVVLSETDSGAISSEISNEDHLILGDSDTRVIKAPVLRLGNRGEVARISPSGIWLGSQAVDGDAEIGEDRAETIIVPGAIILRRRIGGQWIATTIRVGLDGKLEICDQERR